MAVASYLDDVLLARLVLGGPIHCPPSQINGELWLRLVAPKLLETTKTYECDKDDTTDTFVLKARNSVM